MALTLDVLVGAGLLIRSFWRLQQVEPGFETDRLLTLRLSCRARNIPKARRSPRSIDRLQERLAALPGVEAASATSDILLPMAAQLLQLHHREQAARPARTVARAAV